MVSMTHTRDTFNESPGRTSFRHRPRRLMPPGYTSGLGGPILLPALDPGEDAIDVHAHFHL